LLCAFRLQTCQTHQLPDLSADLTNSDGIAKIN